MLMVLGGLAETGQQHEEDCLLFFGAGGRAPALLSNATEAEAPPPPAAPPYCRSNQVARFLMNQACVLLVQSSTRSIVVRGSTVLQSVG